MEKEKKEEIIREAVLCPILWILAFGASWFGHVANVFWVLNVSVQGAIVTNGCVVILGVWARGIRHWLYLFGGFIAAMAVFHTH